MQSFETLVTVFIPIRCPLSRIGLGMWPYESSDALGVHSIFSNFESVGHGKSEGYGADGRIYEFGNFQDTHDWVECESTSFPGKIYFFNLRSSCTTWVRPVARNIRLQRYHRKSRTFDNGMSSDTDNCTMILLSDDEKEEEEEDYNCIQDNVNSLMVNEKVKKVSGKDLDILSRLHYGVDIRKHLINNDGQYYDEYPYGSHAEAHYEGKKLLQFIDSSFRDAAAYSSLKNNKFEKGETLKNRDKKSSGSDDSSLFYEKPIVYSTSEDSYYTGRVPANYGVPRLKRIKPKYLLKNEANGKKKRYPKKKQSTVNPNRKPTKIICEMYGTKTINYDPIEKEPLPLFKTTTLSESSVTSACSENKNQKSVIASSCSRKSSSTSTSCSSCSCSSSSTSTSSSSTTSSSTSKSS